MNPTTYIAADAAEGLAFEHSLFTTPGPQVGIWETSSRAIVCPRNFDQKPGFEEAISKSAAADWPVHLRPTGGGAVPQGPGVVNLVVSFNAPALFTIEDGYRLLTQTIKSALGSAGLLLEPGQTPGSFCDGTWNLSIGGKKVVGTAQRWRPNAAEGPRVLAHALILTDERFQLGTDAVAVFHHDLGLGEVRRNAHTSLAAAAGLSALPVSDLHIAAATACQFKKD